MSIEYRRGALADSRAVFEVFYLALADLIRRGGHQELLSTEEAFVNKSWERRRSLFEHLAQTADNLWVAEVVSYLLSYGYQLTVMSSPARPSFCKGATPQFCISERHVVVLRYKAEVEYRFRPLDAD